jgi:hypothetical protein
MQEDLKTPTILLLKNIKSRKPYERMDQISPDCCGVFGTPSVVVDGKIKSVGKIPKKEDIKTWIGK